jgi:hypothetical protein
MSGHEQDTDIRDSTPNADGPDRAAGGMGVSSEREGHSGPRQVATDGVNDTSPVEVDPEAEVAPEQSAGGDEVKPDGLPPHAGYPSLDPRSEEKPYEA